MKETLVYLDPDQLNETIDRIVRKAIKEQLSIEHDNENPVITINEVAKKLNRSHSTVKKMALAGIFPLTKDGRILTSDLNKYLGINQ